MWQIMKWEMINLRGKAEEQHYLAAKTKHILLSGNPPRQTNMVKF